MNDGYDIFMLIAKDGFLEDIIPLDSIGVEASGINSDGLRQYTWFMILPN